MIARMRTMNREEEEGAVAVVEEVPPVVEAAAMEEEMSMPTAVAISNQHPKEPAPRMKWWVVPPR